MDIIDLMDSGPFWGKFFAAAVALGVLRAFADEEAKRPYVYDPSTKLNYLRTPGVFGICIDGRRLIDGSPPRARFYNPQCYMEFVSLEPSLLLWYVAGWYLLFQRWETMAIWAGVGVLWRVITDVVLRIESPGNVWTRSARTLVKLAWAAASGAFFACMTATALGVLFVMIFVGGMAAGAGGRRRRRRRW